jgi:filamentous hemagglutinin family protein
MRYSWLIVLLFSTLSARPSSPQVKHGRASFHRDPSHFEITAADKTIIEWNSFSIEAGDLTRFIQPDVKAVVLNRVIGHEISQILGKLEANGHVYLINPQGVIFGKDAVINTAGFLASSLDILDEEFLQGTQLSFRGEGGGVENYGTIAALDGDAILIGYTVKNDGIMEAKNGTAAIAAGLEVVIKPTSEEHIFIRPSAATKHTNIGVVQKGTIEAVRAEIQADGNLYSLAIQHEGKTEAVALGRKDGKIFLISETGKAVIDGSIRGESATVHLLCNKIDLVENALIDVSGNQGGGTLWIGGDPRGVRDDIIHADFVHIHPGVTLHADGLGKSNGGEIIVFAEDTTLFYGKATAQGGENGGDGGFIELSGKKSIGLQGLDISTFAPQGKTGMFLLDPAALDISANPTVLITPGPPYPPQLPAEPDFPPNNQIQLSDSGNPANLTVADLITCLGSSNVQITSSADLTVSGVISWNTANNLEFDAGTTIAINQSITCHSGGSLNIYAQNGITISAPITIAGTATSSFPSINMTSQSDGPITITAPIAIGGPLVPGAPGIGNIMITSNGPTGLITIEDLVGCYGGGYVIINSSDGLTVNAVNKNVEIFSPRGQPDPINFNVQVITTADINILANGAHHAQIGCNLDTLSLTSVDSNIGVNIDGDTTSTAAINLVGGSAAGGYAQIGHFGGNAATGPITINGSVQVSAGSGSSTTSLTAGSANNTYAQIGHTPCTNAQTTMIACAEIDVGMQSLPPYVGNIPPSITLSGGTNGSTNAYALIGNGGLPSGAMLTYDGQYFSSSLVSAYRVSPNTTVTVQGGIVKLNGGTGTNSFAAIGVAGLAHCIFNKPYQVITTGTSQVNSGIALDAGGGSSNGAYLGVWFEAPGAISLNSPDPHVINMRTAGFGTSTGAIILNGSTTGTSIAAIGTGSNVAGGNISSYINIQSAAFPITGCDVALNANTGAALIQTGTNALQLTNLDIEVSNNISLKSSAAASASIVCEGDALLIAGNNVQLTGTPGFNSSIKTINNLMLVTDNNTGSLLGPGGFNLDANSFLISTSGQTIYVWTAVAGQNTVSGLINGSAFNAAFTQSFIAWHNGFSTNPYAIFYKGP